MNSQVLKKTRLPDLPGVYLFKKGSNILYIGKATSLKDRVGSYFKDDLINTRGPLLVDMLYQADRVDFIKTDSVLEALILEANLIKKHQPKYNTKEKDNKSFNYVVITKEDFPRVLIVRGKNLSLNNQGKAFGPFPNSTQLKEALKIIRKIFPFWDKCQPLSGKPCFNRQLGLCPGVCDGSISKGDYKKTIKKISTIFSGRLNSLKKNLNKEMFFYTQKQEFEKAKEIRDQLFSLNHIQDVALITTPENNRPLAPSLTNEGGETFRIEAYDLSHLSGANNVGVMVVLEDGELKKSDYRKFKIKNTKGNDIGALKEILERRLKHTEWPKPNLIVVDGGKAQLEMSRSILNKFNLNIPVVSVLKAENHKSKAILGEKSLAKKYTENILLVNNEAHRFAIKYHKVLRKRNFLP